MGDLITKDEAKEMMNIVTGIRKKAEEFGATSTEFKTYSENADARLAKLDEKNEALVKKGEEDRAVQVELKERVLHMETLQVTANGSSHGKELLKADVGDVMNAMLKNQWMPFIESAQGMQKAQRVFNVMKEYNYRDSDGGEKMARIIEDYGRKASTDLLRSDIGELGGFLCPPEYSNELNKNMIEYSPVRRYVRVKRTASKTYKEPLRVGIPVATRPGEAKDSGDNSNPTYAMNDFTPKRLTNTSGVTHDELLFNAYDLSSELMQDNGEAFAVKEGQEFFSGDGVNGGVGWSVDANVPEFETATSTLTFDDMINVTGELKSGYAPMYSFNRRTLAYLRTLKDGDDRYLWNPAFGDAASGAPATINGFRYSAEFIDNDDYDVSTGYPILFADMLKFYQIVDRSDITIIRDEYTRKKEGVVEFTMNKWCFGKPKIYEAGIRMKRKAT